MSELAEVRTEKADDGWTLVFVRELRHSPEAVWMVLTDPDQLAQWAPFTAARDLAELGQTTLTMIDGDAKEDTTAMVLQAEPPRLLEYTWAEDLLRWELEPTPSGTRLTLRHTVRDKDWEPKVAAGWHLCLDVAERVLDGEAVTPIRGREALKHGWQELHDAYAVRLSP